MAASVDIYRWTGSGPTKTPLLGGNTRANAEDAHSTSGTSNPVQIPTTGNNYSYWVSTRLSATSSPANQINNLRWYTDGTNNFPSGGPPTNNIGCVGNEANGNNYSMALGTPGQSGTQLSTTSYPGLTGAPTDVFAWNVGNVKNLAGSLINPATGDFGSFFVYQITVGTSALPGVTNPETFFWKYDET